MLCIWLDRIPARTIVWYERSSYPLRRGSTVRLDARDGLILLDPQGSPLDNTDLAVADQVAHASMLDSGNFVLVGPNSSSTLWESFSHPADTILPTQAIEIGKMLVSRKTQTDLSQGRFYARMDTTGSFLFSTKTAALSEAFDADYYNSNTSNVNASDSGYRVHFDETVSVSVVARDGRSLNTLIDSPNRGADNYYRATLDFDGVFTLYYHPRTFEGEPQWSPVYGPIRGNRVCGITGEMGSGACGYNNLCWVRNDRPVCECPQGFSLADSGNPHGDCNPDYPQECVPDQDQECYMEAIMDVNWPKHDYERLQTSTQQQCRDACLSDYLCAAAVVGGGSCWKKNLPLSNGRAESGSTAFLKRGKLEVKSKRDDDLLHKVLIIVGSLILGGSVLVNLFLTLASWRGTRDDHVPIHDTCNLRCFTYKQLVHATHGFKEELGRGAFGIVYKGLIPNDSTTLTPVAVKKLDSVAQDSDKEFRTEVKVIGQIHHKNVVPLLGFCDEGPNRLLVYEQMSNGTLASFLFGDVKPSWRQRTEMALGVARGLAYLHEECITQIIHCDIKPQNILLDDNYTARISDFGLAKLLMLNQSRTLTNIRGTKGYVSPEWFRNTPVTTKVDVYSFGVVLLEMVSCRKSVEHGDDENPILSDWAWECFREGSLDSLVEFDEEALRDGDMVERFVKVGLWCIEEDADVRPTMRKVCQMLEGAVDVAVPPYPFFVTSSI